MKINTLIHNYLLWKMTSSSSKRIYNNLILRALLQHLPFNLCGWCRNPISKWHPPTTMDETSLCTFCGKNFKYNLSDRTSPINFFIFWQILGGQILRQGCWWQQRGGCLLMLMMKRIAFSCWIIFPISDRVGIGLFWWPVGASQGKRVSSKIHKRWRRLHLETYT